MGTQTILSAFWNRRRWFFEIDISRSPNIYDESFFKSFAYHLRIVQSVKAYRPGVDYSEQPFLMCFLWVCDRWEPLLWSACVLTHRPPRSRVTVSRSRTGSITLSFWKCPNTLSSISILPASVETSDIAQYIGDTVSLFFCNCFDFLLFPLVVRQARVLASFQWFYGLVRATVIRPD